MENEMGHQRDRKARAAARVSQEGMDAYLAGAGRDTCPYHSRYELRMLWIKGFEQAERLAASRPRQFETYQG